MTTASQLLCRTYARYSKFPEFIDYSGSQRLLRADHNKLRIDFAYESSNLLRVIRFHGVKNLLGFFFQTRIADLRQNEQVDRTGAIAKRLGQRVEASRLAHGNHCCWSHGSPAQFRPLKLLAFLIAFQSSSRPGGEERTGSCAGLPWCLRRNSSTA